MSVSERFNKKDNTVFYRAHVLSRLSPLPRESVVGKLFVRQSQVLKFAPLDKQVKHTHTHYIYIYLYTYTHTHIHTYTHSHTHPRPWGIFSV